MKKKRCSGLLMHISSLPGKYGIGTFGKEAYTFVDFLKNSSQKIWQILPLGHTGYGDSPYQCYSAFAGNPLFVDVDMLLEKGYIINEDFPLDVSFSETTFDTCKTMAFVMPLIQKACFNFHNYESACKKEEYNQFCEKNAYWLNDFALFVALKKYFEDKPWYLWPDDIKLRSQEALEYYGNMLKEDIVLYKTIQYFFYEQWLLLKAYANNNGVKIFGDIPLYVAHDSSDAWANAELFCFDADRNPVAVAGVPPDYFSETGQLWGNPLYNWEKHKETGFTWWLSRIEANFLLYDILRIDHFRGLAAYWSVPYGEETAIKGTWINAPGHELFEHIYNKFGDIPIIAEDLGVMTPEVEQLRDSFKLPGMKILQFAFDSSEENEFLPHNFINNCVVYTGTHDNDTTVGWYQSATDEDKESIHAYFNFKPEKVHWELMRLAWASVAFMAIAPVQDLLGLPTDCRMNLPGKPTGYWQWRVKAGDLNGDLAEKLKKMTLIYER